MCMDNMAKPPYFYIGSDLTSCVDYDGFGEVEKYVAGGNISSSKNVLGEVIVYYLNFNLFPKT